MSLLSTYLYLKLLNRFRLNLVLGANLNINYNLHRSPTPGHGLSHFNPVLHYLCMINCIIIIIILACTVAGTKPCVPRPSKEKGMKIGGVGKGNR
jgi:hypothetical protein